ncbi:DNA adenine methylase [Vibrio chagasii]|nr:DNA adenine methylase [Vibrio chagasii]
MVKPFVGAGSVFLNTDYEQYLLADIKSRSFINLYNLLKTDLRPTTSRKQSVGSAPRTTAKEALRYRAQFNDTDGNVKNAHLLSCTLNRRLNGLCRCQQEKAVLTFRLVPYKKPTSRRS